MKNKKEKKPLTVLQFVALIIGGFIIIGTIYLVFEYSQNEDFLDCLSNHKTNGIDFVIVCESSNKTYCQEIYALVEPYEFNWLMCDWEDIGQACTPYEEYPAFLSVENGIANIIGTGMKSLDEIKLIMNC